MKVRRDADGDWHVYLGHRSAVVAQAVINAVIRWRGIWLGTFWWASLYAVLGATWWNGLPPNRAAAVVWWCLAALSVLWPATPTGRRRRAAQFRRAWSWLRGWTPGPVTIIDAVRIRDLSFGPGGLEATGDVQAAHPERVRVRRGPMFGQPRPSAGRWRVGKARRG